MRGAARSAAGEAYPWYVEPAAEGGNEADGPLSAPCYARYLRNASVAFVPPKPKALLSATSTSCLRAWFGT